ncbi:MAG: IS4 family transposase [Legionellaceae bacterium]|nr:IS4 family transposase [Legionellaceae bacterium]
MFGSDLKLNFENVQSFVNSVFKEDMHAKRRLSLSNAVFGVIKSNSNFLHMIGRGLATAKGLVKKHATKQIDRLLSNEKLDVWVLSSNWVPYVIGARKEIYVALDWTVFYGDKHHCICLNLLTKHGRSTPLIWQTVEKEKLKNNTARYEDQLLSRFKEVLPNDVKVTLVADRGFASSKFLEFLEKTLKFDYLIRIKASTLITTNKGTTKKAKEWIKEDGRAMSIKGALITKDLHEIGRFISVQDKDMKAPWLLITNKSDLACRQAVKLYAKRWNIEPYFRDIKDSRFGLGMGKTHINNPSRRDRLILINAIAYILNTILGAAGEATGFDKYIKVNTAKHRTHSLVNQGQYYYEYFPNFSDKEKEILLKKFNQLLEEQQLWEDILCVA